MALSILQGNLFSCNSIPQNDEFSRDYVCGSQNLNDSLFRVWGYISHHGGGGGGTFMLGALDQWEASPAPAFGGSAFEGIIAVDLPEDLGYAWLERLVFPSRPEDRIVECRFSASHAECNTVACCGSCWQFGIVYCEGIGFG